MLQRAKLLQAFRLLERRRRERHIAVERGLAVTVKPDVAVDVGVTGVADVRDDRLREVERILVPIENDGCPAAGSLFLLLSEFLERRSFKANGGRHQFRRPVDDHLVDHGLQHPGRRQKRVSLQVQDDVLGNRHALDGVVDPLGAVADIRAKS